MPMLLLTVVAAMGAMARVYLSWQRGEDPAHPPWTWPAIFWTALAGGILIKGPLILLFVGLTVVALAILDRSAAWLWRLRPVWGLMWLLVLVLPWFVAIFWRAGDTFFAQFGRRRHAEQNRARRNPTARRRGLYLLLFWVTFWPAAPLAGLAAPAVWRARREPGAQYLLAWLIPSWIVFELVLTKLPHYVLPLYPAIAILIVGALERRVLSRSPWLMRGAAWWFAIPAIAAVSVIVGAIALTRQPAFLAWPFLAASLIFGLFAWWLYDDNRAERSLLNAVVCGACSWRMAVYGIVLPSLTPLFPEPRNRARAAQRRLRRTESRRRRLSRAESGLHDRDLDAADRRLGRRGFPGPGQLPLCAGGIALGTQLSPSAPKPSGCATMWRPAIDGYNFSQGKAISVAIFRSEGTDKCQPDARPAPRRTISTPSGCSRGARLAQLVRPPSHSRRAEAARRCGAPLAVSHGGHRGCDHRADVRAGCDGNRLDAAARHRRALAGSHPDRLREIGLCAVGAGRRSCSSSRCMFPLARGTARSVLHRFRDPRCSSYFFAVLLPVLAGEVMKWTSSGAGGPSSAARPMPSTSAHFAGTEAYASFPSGHATTAFALAFAVSALWPQARP